MANVKYVVTLTGDEREGLLAVVDGGRAPATQTRHANILLVLNLAGMTPGVGPWADLANAGPCAWEGDWLGAGQSIWSAMPGIGDAFQGSKVATGVSKFASHGDDVAGAAGKGISRGSMTAREIIAAEKKAGVDKKFPGELLNNTLDEITKMSRREGKLKGIAQTAYKLLTNHKFDKGDNGKRGKL